VYSFGLLFYNHLTSDSSPAERMQEDRVLHDAKLAKMEAEMKMVFQQKVQEKEAKLKQSEEELYARHKEMKDALDKQRSDLEEKKRKIESGRPLTPEKSNVSRCILLRCLSIVDHCLHRPQRRTVSSGRRLLSGTPKLCRFHS
jgi:septin 7